MLIFLQQLMACFSYREQYICKRLILIYYKFLRKSQDLVSFRNRTHSKTFRIKKDEGIKGIKLTNNHIKRCIIKMIKYCTNGLYSNYL